MADKGEKCDKTYLRSLFCNISDPIHNIFTHVFPDRIRNFAERKLKAKTFT